MSKTLRLLPLFIIILKLVLINPEPGYSQEVKTLSEEIGPGHVWVPTSENLRSLMNECAKNYAYTEIYLECVINFMKNNGAPSKAIEFTRLMQGDAFLTAFFETGIVDVVKFITPFRGRNNENFLLVNGKSFILDVDDPSIITDNMLNLNDDYRSLKLRYPDLQVCKGGHSFPEYDSLINDGHRFVFTYALAEDCMFIDKANYAAIAFDFDKEGYFIGASVVSVIRKE